MNFASLKRKFRAFLSMAPPDKKPPKWLIDHDAGTIRHRDSGITFRAHRVSPVDDWIQVPSGAQVCARFEDSRGARYLITWLTADRDQAIERVSATQGEHRAHAEILGIPPTIKRAWNYRDQTIPPNPRRDAPKKIL